jgi:hypothetical protein
MAATPLVGLLSIAIILTGFRTVPEHRKWRLTGGGLALLVVIATFAWFVPNIMKLGSLDILSAPREEVASLAHAWVTLNWIRVVIYSTAWLAALKALTVASR